MDFLNKLSKKTTEVYQGAKEKTVKISEEIKLKNKVSALKEKVNSEYLEIGKSVYDKMKVGEDASKEEIAPRCEEISRLKEEIEKIEADVLALKNIKKCVNCGAELQYKADFCSKCGAAQPKVEDVKVEDVKVEVAEEPATAEEVEVTEVTEVEPEKVTDNSEEDKSEE